MTNEFNNDDLSAVETAPPKLAGDWLDDDGTVMDDLLRNQSDPPTPADLPVSVGDLPTVKPPVVNRLVCRNYSIPKVAGAPPVMLLASDPNRTSLVLKGLSSSGDLFVISSDANDLTGAAVNAFVCDDFSNVVLDSYTGALWIAPYDIDNHTTDMTGATGSWNFTVLAVTK